MAPKRIKKKGSKTEIDMDDCISFEQTIRILECATREEAYARYAENVRKITDATAKIANKQERASERDAMIAIANVRYEEDLFVCIKALYSGTHKRLSERFDS